MNIESMYKYGSRAGFWRLDRLFVGRGIPVKGSANHAGTTPIHLRQDA
ncbi:putative urate catabolism protein [Chondrocystis sp. NIES-4102]|nr:putative urate catabolism protein [Chondrocystis sp. NIES-4102]